MAEPAYTEGQSYCSPGDVESLVGKGAFSTTTVPTLARVLNFAAERAAGITAVMWANGVRYTTSSGSNPIPTNTDIGAAIERLTRQANAMLAAGDAFVASDISDTNEPPAQSVALWDEGRRIIETLLVPMLAAVDTPVDAASGQSVRTHTATGGVSKADFLEAPHDAEVDRSSLFSLRSKF